jgi:hypothetical protein
MPGVDAENEVDRLETSSAISSTTLWCGKGAHE